MQLNQKKIEIRARCEYLFKNKKISSRSDFDEVFKLRVIADNQII